jgi:lipoprotein-releasing system permease protein
LNFKNFLVSRFLKSKQERFPLISIFGMGGIVIGVFAIITVISVMKGFEKDLVKRLTGTQPHLYIIDKNDTSSLKNWKDILEKLSNNQKLSDKVISASPFVESEAILYFNKTTMGVVVFGADANFFEKMLINEPEHRQLVLGQQLAFSNDIIKGDSVELVSAWDAVTSSGTAPRMRTFKVFDLVRTGTYVRDLKYVYVNIDNAMSYFTPEKDVPTGIVMFCKKPADIQDTKLLIGSILSEYKDLEIETWVDRNSRLFYSLKIERLAMLLTLIFVVLIASFSIVVSLVLMVESKKRDFIVLMSMGLKKNMIRNVLLRIALIKGVLGSLLGGVLATVFCYLQKEYKFISLPAIYYETRLPVDMNIGFNMLVVFLAIFICILGALFPIRLINRFSIVSQLRKDN